MQAVVRGRLDDERYRVLSEMAKDLETEPSAPVVETAGHPLSGALFRRALARIRLPAVVVATVLVGVVMLLPDVAFRFEKWLLAPDVATQSNSDRSKEAERVERDFIVSGVGFYDGALVGTIRGPDGTAVAGALVRAVDWSISATTDAIRAVRHPQGTLDRRGAEQPVVLHHQEP